MTGPACGNNPNHQMTDGDRQAVDSFRAYLTARATLNRVRAVLETEAVVGRTALEYRGLILTALTSEAPPADQTTPSCRAGLRDEIAAALEAADYRMDMRRGDLADAVLPVLYREWPWLRAEAEDAVLPATTDQTAALSPAERTMLTYALDQAQEHIWAWDGFTDEDQAAVDSLRRMADETQPAEPEPEWARPETEEEKLAKARRMAKALSAPPVAPPEWEATTEWPSRHKCAGDRRVHATAPFEINGVRRFWTACEKPVERGGFSLNHMPVNCRDCKRATAAGARQDGAQQ